MNKYPYESDWPRLFDDPLGRATLGALGSHVEMMSPGDAIDFGQALHVCMVAKGGVEDSWLVLNALDYLVTRCELRETSPQGAWGQERTFVKGGEDA